jgi:hypothetical protein
MLHDRELQRPVPVPLRLGVLMRHVAGFIAGGVAFAAAHAIEASHWSDWFEGQYAPWFLNSGRALLFTVAVVALISVAIGALNRAQRPVRGIAIGGGACAAMAVLLFLSPGPGTIFPIVLAVGGVALLGSSIAGAWAGTVIRRKAGARS